MQSVITPDKTYYFVDGINILTDEIDSGVWAASYALSMYNYHPKNFVLFRHPDVVVNGDEIISLNDFSQESCYMDLTFPMFSSKTSVKKLIMRSLKSSGSQKSLEEIQEIFDLDSFRLERPISNVGNEIFRAMSAIGYSSEKQVYCFPWMSHNRFQYYNNNVSKLLYILEDLKKTIILPLGK